MDLDKIIWTLQNGLPETCCTLMKMVSSMTSQINEFSEHILQENINSSDDKDVHGNCHHQPTTNTAISDGVAVMHNISDVLHQLQGSKHVLQESINSSEEKATQRNCQHTAVSDEVVVNHKQNIGGALNQFSGSQTEDKTEFGYEIQCTESKSDSETEYSESETEATESELEEKANEADLIKSSEAESVSEDAQSENDSNPKLIKLFEVKPNSKIRNYRDEKGFLYTKVNNRDTKNLYFRCRSSERYPCHSRVIAKGGDLKKCVLKAEHSHNLETKYLDRITFNCELDKLCENLPHENGRDIFLKTKENVRESMEDIKSMPELNQCGSFIHRRKKKHIPKLPKTVDELHESITDEKWKATYSNDIRKFPFYRGVWSNLGGGENVVFISETVLRVILTMSAIFLRVDGTFKVLPYHLKFRQLFIISVIYNDHSYPLAYILMKKRNYSSYCKIFKNLKKLISANKVSEIMCDYEPATRKAVKKHFPEARLTGCYFHYVQAIYKAAKRFGLKKDKKFEIVVELISALALLPNDYISEGFGFVNELVKSHSQRWNRFKKYWFRQWEGANISVYGLTHRTNNFAESLNRSINALLKKKGPHIWLLIHKIRLLEMNYSDRIEKASSGATFPHKPCKQMTEFNDKIKQATLMFDETKDVGRFLKSTTFGGKLELLLKERVNLNADDYVDSDYDDEQIIPNYYNIETNAKLNKKMKRQKRGSSLNNYKPTKIQKMS